MATYLFAPFKSRELVIRNRIFVSPMCQYSAENGVPNNWHLVHLGSRAVGGAGLVMVEATSVSPEGRISPDDTGLWNHEQANAFKPITQFIKEHGAAAAIQLAHAGRKASTASPWKGGKLVAAGQGGWQPIAPSAVAFAPGYPVPTAMSVSLIEQVVSQFEASARLALEAGFQIVEIHMAHGYLLHEFLSPLANRRDDQFGGSLANRMRFPFMVAEAVRSVWPETLPVFVRVSATDWVDGGWDLEQTLAFALELKKIGIDLIDTSSGGMVADARIPVSPGFQVPLAAAIRNKVDIPTGAVGLISDAKQAEAILQEGAADVILLGRQFLRDPYFPLKAAKELNVEIQWPAQYERGK